MVDGRLTIRGTTPSHRSMVWAEGQKLWEHFSVQNILAADRFYDNRPGKGLLDSDTEEFVMYLLMYSWKATSNLRHLELSETNDY